MNLITSKNITVFLKKIFEVEKDFISKRSELVDLINYQGAASYEDIRLKVIAEKKIIMDDFKANKITREDTLLKVNEIHKYFKIERQKLSKIETCELFKELKENYNKKIVLNGFTNELVINSEESSVLRHPNLSYEKKYDDHLFTMKFSTNVAKEEIALIFMNVENSNKESFSMNLELDSNNNVSVASITLEHRQLYIYSNGKDQTHKDFLSSLEESVFSSLDSKEQQELSSILYDFSLDLSNESTYNFFKEGFNDFKDVMKKELAKENRITNKI